MTDDNLNKIIAHTDVVLNNWTQTVSVIHAGQSIDISSDAIGRLSTIPVKAPINSQIQLPHDSKYRFNILQFKGLDQLKSIKRLILGPSFCPGCQMVASHHIYASPHCQGTLHFSCSKHHITRTDNAKMFSQGNMSMDNKKTRP
jgi:hypothetical protein